MIRVWLAIILLACGSSVASALTVANTEVIPALYDTTLNHQPVGIVRFLLSPNQTIYLHESEFGKLHLRIPSITPWQFDGQVWYPLNSLAGSKFEQNMAEQSIAIELAPEAFLSNAIGETTRKTLTPTLPNWGAYSNFELFTGQSTITQQVIAGMNTNVFGPIGNFSSSFIGQSLRTPNTQSTRLIPQETRWSRDWPEAMLNAQVGDSQVKSSLWGRAAHFGGVHIGSNFATQPEFAATAMPLLAGSAALPSTVELYVDGQLRKTFDVPIGPFQLNEFPELAGQGEVKIIIRDSLGREQQVIAPYAATPLLLKAGVMDYQFNAGVLRRNFGQANSDYGRLMSSATVRQGRSETFTVEARAELLSDQASLGAGASWLTGLGVASSACALSNSINGTGALGLLALESQAKSGLSYALKGQFADSRFVQIQEEINLTPLSAIQPQFLNAALAQLQAIRAITNPQRLLNGNLGWRYSGGAYLGASYTERNALNQVANKIASVNYSTRIGTNLSLNATLLAVLGATPSQSLLFTLSMPLDQQGTNALFSTATQNNKIQPVLQVQKSPAPDWGYHTLLVGGLNQQQEAGVSLQTETWAYNLSLAHAQTGGSYRSEARGALAFIDGDLFSTRTIQDSFALVHVPGYPNLPISANNRVVAHTNSKGDALLPELQSYRDNQLAIDPLALPLDAHAVESSIAIIPYSHTGLIKTVAIKRNRSALITLLLENGNPAPLGMNITLIGNAEKFMVGMRGEVYVTELSTQNKFHGEWQGKVCSFDYTPPVEANEISYTEPIICSPTKH